MRMRRLPGSFGEAPVFLLENLRKTVYLYIEGFIRAALQPMRMAPGTALFQKNRLFSKNPRFSGGFRRFSFDMRSLGRYN